MKSVQELAKAFGTHDHYIELWINKMKITKEEIEFALSNFDKHQRRRLMQEYIRPEQYLVEHPGLINHVQTMDIAMIKELPEQVFMTHLEQLQKSDNINDEINDRSFPYNSYDAEIFTTLRFLTKTADIKFIKGMFTRSISHSAYPKAKQKLTQLAQQCAA